MKAGLLYFTDTYLTVLGLIIFFGYFVFITIRALRFDRKEISYLEQIPFNHKD